MRKGTEVGGGGGGGTSRTTKATLEILAPFRGFAHKKKDSSSSAVSFVANRFCLMVTVTGKLGRIINGKMVNECLFLIVIVRLLLHSHLCVCVYSFL